jgi:hypothetical protein
MDDGSFAMKSVIAGISLIAVSAIVVSGAYADGQGIGRAGEYQTPDTTQGVKTRAEVRAEIATAYDDGTLPNLNRIAYPGRGLTGEVIAARHEKKVQEAALAERRNRAIVEYANGSTVQSGGAAAR